MNGWIIAGPVLGAYFSAWLVAARMIFNTMRIKDHLYDDGDMAMYGVASMFFGLFWPLIVVGIGPWMFVTGSVRRDQRRRDLEIKTARLERDIYGRSLDR